MSTSKGITITVTAETNAGGRRHMEDYLAVNLAPSDDSFNKVSYLREQAYVGVFDGHGGKEAAKCAREGLWDMIQKQPKFRSSNLNTVMESVREAYLAMHKQMEPLRDTWKRNKTGDLSTAGTTASIVIFRQDHIIVANVGDSTAVLAVSNPLAGTEGQHPVLAKPLTIDHKPEDPSETERIEKQGGKVMLSRKGVPRVVWQRARKPPNGGDSPDGTPVLFDTIPFLSVARSLGDFWSFSPTTKEFAVSPCPDVHIHPLDLQVQKFVVVASDGLWNVMTPQQVVEFVWDYENDSQTCHKPRDVVKAVINEALRRWKAKNLPADNIAVLIAFLSEEEIVSKNSDTSSPIVSQETARIATSDSPTPVMSTSEIAFHSEEEIVSKNSDTSSPIVSQETTTSGSPTPVMSTSEDKVSPASSSSGSGPVTGNVTVEFHTKTKHRHRKKMRAHAPSCKFTTTLSPSTEESSSLGQTSLGKRLSKDDDCDETLPMKRGKFDNVDSGLDVDSHTDTTESPVDEKDDISSRITSTFHHFAGIDSGTDTSPVANTPKDSISTNKTIPMEMSCERDQVEKIVDDHHGSLPLEMTCEVDEDSSSGVSSDNSEPDGMGKHASNPLCSEQAVSAMECLT